MKQNIIFLVIRDNSCSFCYWTRPGSNTMQVKICMICIREAGVGFQTVCFVEEFEAARALKRFWWKNKYIATMASHILIDLSRLILFLRHFKNEVIDLAYVIFVLFWELLLLWWRWTTTAPIVIPLLERTKSNFLLNSVPLKSYPSMISLQPTEIVP